MTKDNLIIRLNGQPISRRHFLAGTGAAALAFSTLPVSLVRGAEASSKINLGLIGCGGRGQWIANLFLKHGGYNLTAAADYFPEKVDNVGQKFNVPTAKRFTGLSCYKRLLEAGVEAVAIESPPYFHPEQAAAAVSAGKHVYLAKPIAVDAPGCQTVAESGKKARANKLCFLVDFQTRTHPAYQEVVKRVHAGGIGRLVNAEAAYKCGLIFKAMDAEYRKNPKHPEARLKAWAVDRVLSGDIITEQNIHALDVATWFFNADPIQAYGTGGRVRPYLGNCWDNFAVIFYFPDNVTVSFCSSQVGFGYEDIMCRVYGTEGSADTHYGAKVMLRSREDIFNGDANNLSLEGTMRNIAMFYDNITGGDYSNPTVTPSVRSNLTCILGRTAAYKTALVTWKAMMRANEKLEVSFKGCKD
jgi:myo-inositol 2-dehydrogenase/D-chiro-inositol 1-dehydrogenase